MADPLDLYEPAPSFGAAPYRPPVPDGPSVAGVLGRRASRAALPTTAGLAAFPVGAEIGGAIGGLAGPGAAVASPVGAVLGGLGASIFGAGAVQAAEDWIVPQRVKKWLGWDAETRAADEAAHPVAAFAGDIAPQAMFMRPSFSLALKARAAGAAIAAGVEGGIDYAETGKLDPARMGLQAVAGAALDRNTALGDIAQIPAHWALGRIPWGAGATAARTGARGTVQSAVGDAAPTDDVAAVEVMRSTIGPDRLTPDERAAAHVIEAESFDEATSPFIAGAIGAAEHGEQLTAALAAVLADQPPPRLPAPSARWAAPDALHEAVQQVESRGRDDAVSPVGARGRMQVMPGTTRDPGFGVRPAANDSPEELARVGRDYLDAMLDRYDGDQVLALSAYNAGPGTVDRWIARFGDPRKGGISSAEFARRIPFRETREYVPNVLSRAGGEVPERPIIKREVFAEEEASPIAEVPPAEVMATVASVEDDGLGPSAVLTFLPRRGSPGIEVINEEGQFATAVFRDADGRAQGGVRLALTEEARALGDEVSSYVRPEFRRQGIGTRLYDALRDAGHPIDQASGAGDLTPEGAAFVNSRRRAVTGPFGPAHPELADNWPAAVERLKSDHAGVVPGALWHPDIGAIDVPWGAEGTGKSNGMGLAKLVAHHPEVVDELPEILAAMDVVSRTRNRVRLESANHEAAVSLEWKGDPSSPWILSAYEKQRAPALTVDERVGAGGRDGSPDLGAEDNIVLTTEPDKAELLFDQPGGAGTVRQSDLIEHDLRMAIEADPSLAARMDAEGDVVNVADLLAGFDSEASVIDALRACLTPGGNA